MMPPEKRLDAQSIVDILSQSVFAKSIYTGKELYIQYANTAMLNIWGKTTGVFGLPLAQGLPEIKDAYFVKVLSRVWESGNSVSEKDVKINLVRDGECLEHYFDLEYTALYNNAGGIYGILHTMADVTERIYARNTIEEKEQAERALNEELSAANEELYSSNEELAAMNEEISSVNEELRLSYENAKQLNAELTSSEIRFKNMIKTTPMGLAVISGQELIIETANQPVLDIWGRKLNEVVGKGLIEIFPELEGQPFPGYLRSVLETGKAIGFPELPAKVNQPDGSIKNIYVDFSYDPLADADGNITSILVSVNDITATVAARKEIQEQREQLAAVNEELETSNEEVRSSNRELKENQEKLLALNEELKKSEDSQRLTVEAANLGTWSLEISTGRLQVNQRWRDLFGYEANENITVKDVLNRFDPEYLPVAQKELANAVEHDMPSDFQYPYFNPKTKEQLWIKSTGRTYFDTEGQSKWFYGAVLDITEQKRDEQRKNDFIGMVSHELKTPLTSLNAYLQMLELRARNSGDEKTLGALTKSVKQIKKMTTMINGFLNVSRLESGKMHIDRQLFDMAGLVKEVEEETIVTISSHNIVFAPVEETIVLADKDKIGQVINNFVSNAVKYSASGTTINIACTTEQGCAFVRVRDEGMGIDTKDQEKLFDRYYRVEGKHTATISGFGIGLYLCAEIIQRHDGKIGVESEPGKGSAFWFSIPLA